MLPNGQPADPAMDSHLHRAKWVYPVSTPVIEGGAVWVASGRIEAVGPFRSIIGRVPTRTTVIDHGQGALIPGLVNAHTHLEWTSLAGRIPFPRTDFASWLKLMIEQRGDLEESDRVGAIRNGRALIGKTATALYANTANLLDLHLRRDLNLRRADCEKPHRRTDPTPNDEREGCEMTFFEVLGFDEENLQSLLPKPLTVSDPAKSSIIDSSPVSLAAHACYSTSPQLIRQAKAWTRKQGRPFSIHTAEHRHETEFMHSGTGFCRELLGKLGRWNPGWHPPGSSPVAYLEQLGVLDPSTILVHAVHLNDDDWNCVAHNGCSVCFCPRSNHNLNVGQPDISTALNKGIVVALGTDSLASNTDLDLLREAGFVLTRFSQIDPALVLQMITAGGAKALRQSERFGSLQPHRSGRMLVVDLPVDASRGELPEIILHTAIKGEWRWAD